MYGFPPIAISRLSGLRNLVAMRLSLRTAAHPIYHVSLLPRKSPRAEAFVGLAIVGTAKGTARERERGESAEADMVPASTSGAVPSPGPVPTAFLPPGA